MFKRLCNLWKLSAYEPLEAQKIREGDTIVQNLIKSVKKAQIIKRHNDPAGEIVGDKK